VRKAPWRPEVEGQGGHSHRHPKWPLLGPGQEGEKWRRHTGTSFQNCGHWGAREEGLRWARNRVWAPNCLQPGAPGPGLSDCPLPKGLSFQDS
jgi:hypothetical protein